MAARMRGPGHHLPPLTLKATAPIWIGGARPVAPSWSRGRRVRASGAALGPRLRPSAVWARPLR